MTNLPPPVLVLRPEPGNTETIGRLVTLGVTAIPTPLYRVEPLSWAIPDLDMIDALLLTSANAVRHAGPGLSTLKRLPVWCVGPATAVMARSAGLRVVHAGLGDLKDLLSALSSDHRPPLRLLWLCGQQRTTVEIPAPSLIMPLEVYGTIDLPLPVSATVRPCIALLHSRRAARRFAAVAADPQQVALIAISAAVAHAAGSGWRSLAVADYPDDGEMVVIAQKLCQSIATFTPN